MKRAFTLLEVNLAILIMATGVLTMCALYSLGFRENRQSVEDVSAAGLADAVMGPLVQGLSATNMPWSTWVNIGDEPSDSDTKDRNVADGIWPENGWLDYVKQVTSPTQTDRHRMNGDPSSRARSVFQQVIGKVPSPYKGSFPSGIPNYHYALVVTRRGAVIQLSFRSGKRKETLMSQPIFVSEVHFQGDPEL